MYTWGDHDDGDGGEEGEGEGDDNHDEDVEDDHYDVGDVDGGGVVDDEEDDVEDDDIWIRLFGLCFSGCQFASPPFPWCPFSSLCLSPPPVCLLRLHLGGRMEGALGGRRVWGGIVATALTNLYFVLGSHSYV